MKSLTAEEVEALKTKPPELLTLNEVVFLQGVAIKELQRELKLLKRAVVFR